MFSMKKEEKLQTANEYLLGKGTTYSIANKYSITNASIRSMPSKICEFLQKYKSLNSYPVFQPLSRRWDPGNAQLHPSQHHCLTKK